LRCFTTSNSKSKRTFPYRLSPETFGYTLVRGILSASIMTARYLKMTVEPSHKALPLLFVNLLQAMRSNCGVSVIQK